MSNVFQVSEMFVDPIIENKYSYIVVRDATSNTDYTQNVFLKAPITNIRIDETTDVDITRGLNGGFNLTIFQSPPIAIRMSGVMSVLKSACPASNNTIELDTFFSTRNVTNYTNGSTALIITVGTVSYIGYLLSFTKSASRYPGVMQYELVFYCTKL